MSFNPGQVLYASQLDMVNSKATNNVTGTTTSTSLTATLTGTSTCGAAFSAPPSGKVIISWACEIGQNTVGAYAICSPHVRTGSTIGSGTTVYASDLNNVLRRDGTGGFDRMGAEFEVTGLTPGDSYNVILEHVVSSGTGTFTRRQVIVKPQLA